MALSLWGTSIRINPFFLAVCLVYFAAGVIDRAAIAFATVLLHEMGHVFAARRLGIRAESVELFPFGGVVRLKETAVLSPLQEIKMSLAGPLTSIGLFCLGLGLMKCGYLTGSRGQFFLTVNLTLAVFNLLPGLPLDGGRMLRAWLSCRKDLRTATVFPAKIGQLLGVIITSLGVAGIVFRWWGLDVAALGLFVLYAATGEKLRAPYLFIHSLAGKERALMQRQVCRGALLVATEDAPLLEIVRCFKPGSYCLVAVVNEKGERKGIYSEAEVIAAFTSSGSDAKARVLAEETLG